MIMRKTYKNVKAYIYSSDQSRNPTGSILLSARCHTSKYFSSNSHLKYCISLKLLTLRLTLPALLINRKYNTKKILQKNNLQNY